MTAGNSSGLTDGATGCLLAAADVAAELGLPIRMRMVSFAFAGVDPETMGTGPIPATEKALAKAGLTIEDIGLIEINEAFAVQVLAFTDHFGLADDDPRINPDGGAISMGHPLASSGVRLMTQLARQFSQRPDVRYGLTTMCVGLGMGGTVVWENPHWTGDSAPSRLSKPPKPAETTEAAARCRSDHLRHRRDRGRSRQVSTPTDTELTLPGEVVTSAALRLIDVPGVDGRVALITIDNGKDHTRPTTFGPAGLRNLDKALDDAFAARPAAVAVTGKPFVFAAGADLSGIGMLPDRETAHAVGALGHRVFRRLRDSDVPTFAFVNGVALGGGVELALHCHFRTIAANVTMVGLPECFLGILSGWGGTQLLPRIAGPETAVTVIIENALNQNRMIGAAEAAKLGMVDAVFDSADYLEQSLIWLATVLDGSITVSRTDFAAREHDDAWTSALQRGRLIAEMRTHGAAPAPFRALELIERARTADLTDLTPGFAAEDDALADLIFSDEFRAGIYAFDLTQKRARKPAGAPNPGAGAAGHQGRRDRRRADGMPIGPAVRPPHARSSGAHRRRPGQAGQGSRRSPSGDRHAHDQEADQPRRGQPAGRPDHRIA